MQQAIIAAALSQVEIAKFRHQGRIPGQWLDCAGLIAYVADQIGADYNELPGYGRVPNNGLLESVLDNQPCLERVFDKQPGDILLMRFAKEPQHVAIFTGDTIIHSYEAVGKVCEHRLDSVWAKRIVRIYRFKTPVLSEVEA